MDLAIEFSKIQEAQDKILSRILEMQTFASKKNMVYTIDDLAEMFKVTPRTIYNWKDQGLMSFTQIGSKTYMTSAQLEEFLARNEVKSVKNRRNLP